MYLRSPTFLYHFHKSNGVICLIRQTEERWNLTNYCTYFGLISHKQEEFEEASTPLNLAIQWRKHIQLLQLQHVLKNKTFRLQKHVYFSDIAHQTTEWAAVKVLKFLKNDELFGFMSRFHHISSLESADLNYNINYLVCFLKQTNSAASTESLFMHCLFTKASGLNGA